MNRLTKRGAEGYAYFPFCIECNEEVCPRECSFAEEICEVLARYEDYEERCERDKETEEPEGISCK